MRAVLRSFLRVAREDSVFFVRYFLSGLECMYIDFDVRIKGALADPRALFQRRGGETSMDGCLLVSSRMPTKCEAVHEFARCV